eukprot:CAMPEP_0204419736 /NCGR_PEP_ID=MMETSP0470-20130426/31036_1 /ASSEMBLY_ACC=CAM_ASM_000385 /TAXON_ID=2969 /ORGANISM="Oxyrrhis marina" /LENGTH=184 /DNA_ID=CAMNT_0051416597 /DNA_START=452 /DNA_END=1003 /DNA_ORIENTATION=-
MFCHAEDPSTSSGGNTGGPSAVASAFSTNPNLTSTSPSVTPGKLAAQYGALQGVGVLTVLHTNLHPTFLRGWDTIGHPGKEASMADSRVQVLPAHNAVWGSAPSTMDHQGKVPGGGRIQAGQNGLSQQRSKRLGLVMLTGDSRDSLQKNCSTAATHAEEVSHSCCACGNRLRRPSGATMASTPL